MIGNIRRWVTQIWLVLSLGMLTFSAGARAGEVDLDKPIKIERGKGVAIFSITFHGATQDASYVKWREVREDKRMPTNWNGMISITRGDLFGTEELSESSRHVFGRFAALTLPPGSYEFYDFNSEQVVWQPGGTQRLSLFHARRPFSRQFNVEADKIQYVGNLDIYEGQSFLTTGGLMAGVFLGMFGTKVEIFPSLLDAGEEDIPMIIAKGNGLSAEDISFNVTNNAEDQHTQAMFEDLHNKAEQGDVYAQRRLLLGLQRGLVMTETGEEFKVQKNSELQKSLADQLSAKGISGGDYGLAILQEPGLVTGQLNKLPADEDGQKLLDEARVDAKRYFSPAMYMVYEMYSQGLPGVEKDREQALLWLERYQSMNGTSSKFVPYLDAAGKAEFKKYNSASNPRYFALSASGAYGLSTGDDASVHAAITLCEERNGGSTERCRLYSRHGLMNWDACPAEYANPQASTFPSQTGLGEIDDIKRLPAAIGDNGKKIYRDFLEAIMPRAFAVADNGETGMASGDCHAAYKALQLCREHSGKTCQLYAIDDQIVLGATDPELVEQQQRLAALVEKTVQLAANEKSAAPEPNHELKIATKATTN